MAIILINPNKPLIPVKYYVKSLTAYIPSTIIGDRKMEIEKLAPWYEKINGEFSLNSKSYSYNDKKKIFSTLSQMGYYDEEKNISLFNAFPYELYFAPLFADGCKFEPMFHSTLNDVKNVGVVFTNGEEFYRYWAYYNMIHHKKVNMYYISYSKDFKNIQNEKNETTYNYILTDNLDYLIHLIGRNNITKITSSGELSMVKLQNEQTVKYCY